MDHTPEQLRQILDQFPDGLVTMDKKGRVTYFNSGAERITGIPAKEALGMHCRNLFKSTTCETACTQPGDGHNGKNLYDQEFRVTRLDGKQISIISSISILRDSGGKVIGGMEVFKDISSRKALEDNLRISESKFRRIFEGSQDMIFITAKDGGFKDVNQAGVDLLGFDSKEELLALSSVEKIYQNPMHRKVYQKEMERQGFVRDFEARFKKKDGGLLYCLVSGTAIKDSSGEIVGYEGIIKDITARMDAIRDLKKRHRELSLLNSVALSMNMTQNLDDVLYTALVNVLDVLGLSSGAIFLIDHTETSFSLRVQQELPDSVLNTPFSLHFHDCELKRALLNKELSLTPKPIFPPFKIQIKSDNTLDSQHYNCFLITAKEKASGFIALDSEQVGDLTEHDLHLLGSLGNFLGGAIENNQLVQTIRKHREELKQLTAKLFQSQETERKRIARELHDEAGQALTGINFSLETVEKSIANGDSHINELIGDIKKQLNRTYEEMRRISHRLHPALLTDLGLEPALDSYLTHISKHSDLKVHFRMVGFKNRIDPELETLLYRLSQEALTNTLKHAGAKSFHLSIIRSYPNIILVAEDDGVGFDASKMDQHQHALGLLSMRERAAMAGGKFTLRTAPGEGVRIRIEISIKRYSHDQ